MYILYIALAGALGTLARFGVERLVSGPRATLLVNLAGSLVLGFIMHYATRSAAFSPQLRATLAIGFCGAFTTTSTFSYESLGFLTQGHYARAATYMSATIVGCLAAVFAGMMLADRVLN